MMVTVPWNLAMAAKFVDPNQMVGGELDTHVDVMIGERVRLHPCLVINFT